MAPFWTNFGLKNRSKIKVEKRSIFGESGIRVGGKGGAQGGPNYHRNQDNFDFGIYDIDLGINDNVSYTPDSPTGGAAAD